MPSEKPYVSIIIRAFNEERFIGKLFAEISKQNTDFPFETILVDSGSTDGTLRIAERFPVRVVQINPEDFSFGYSLNRGIQEAQGELCVIVSAHCYPTDPSWLARLVAPLAIPQYALSFGRQRGVDSTRFSEHEIFQQWFPDESVADYQLPFCNNANSAIRRSVWEQIPYDETLTGLEDIHWAKMVRERGHKIAYRADATVSHVHDETSKQIFQRYYREAIAYRAIFKHERFGFLDFLRFFLSNSFSDLAHAAHAGKLFAEGMDVLRFRFLQFWATYRAHAYRVSVSKDMQRRLYYSRAPFAFGLGRRPRLVPKGEAPDAELIDISEPLSPQLPVWPGAERFRIDWKKDFASCGCNESHISMNIHTGTHMDAPFHFSKGGSRMAGVNLSKMIGPVTVVEYFKADPIPAEFLRQCGLGSSARRVIFKTLNSYRNEAAANFDENFVAIAKDGAEWLRDHKIDLVGIDGPSVQSFHEKSTLPHTILLDAEIVVLEGLRMRDVAPGEYHLIALPLHIPDAEGAPVRAVLKKGSFL